MTAKRKEGNWAVLITIQFTLPELLQIESYVEYRDRDGWYYGRKEHFEKRHSSIQDKIAAAIGKEKYGE